MDREAEFHQLDRDKLRYEKFGYLVGNIPMNDEHRIYLEKAATSKRTEVEVDGFDDEDHGLSSPARHSQITLPPGKSVRKNDLSPRPSLKAATDWAEGAVAKSRARIRDGDLDANEITVKLSFDCPTGPDRKHEGPVLLDTGVGDDWIADSMAKQLGLPLREDEDSDEQFLDFNCGQVTRSVSSMRSGGVENRRPA